MMYREALSSVGAQGVWDAESRSEPTPQRVSYWLLVTFLGLLYANLPIVFPASEVIHPAKILAGAGILAVLNETFVQRRKFEVCWPDAGLMLAFLGAAALSCVGALWPGYAADAVSDLAKMTIVYFFLVTCANNEQGLRGVMWVMVLGGLLPALGTIKNYLQGNVTEGRAAWVGIFANPNEVAYSLAILLPLMAYLGSTRGWLTRVVLTGIAALFVTAIFVTFSRGGLIGLGAALGIYAWRKRSVWFQVVLAGAVVAGLFFGAQHWSRQQDFSQLDQDVSFQQRLATSKAGIDMFLDHPLLGVGIACSVVAWPLYAPHDLYTRGALITHNTFIQALSETGILGFIPFVLFIIAGISHTFKLATGKDRRLSGIGVALEAALWGFVVCGMSGGYVLTWFPYLLLGLAGAATRIANNQETSDDSH